MASTIVALAPVTGNRGLLVEVHPELMEVTPDIVRAFSERMFLRNIRVGMIVARKDTVVLRDTLSSVEFRDNRYEQHALDTDALFNGAKIAAHSSLSGPEFVKCVVRMLGAIASLGILFSTSRPSRRWFPTSLVTSPRPTLKSGMVCSNGTTQRSDSSI